MEPELLLLSATQPRCRVLGPGVRYVVWVQGCPFSCPGCIAESMHSLEGGRLYPVEKLARAILSEPDIEGVTLSGGEPFLQAAELTRLLRLVRSQRDLGVIVYTGFLYEQLVELSSEHPEIADLLSCVDLLIDGPYRQEENRDCGIKGSENQRTILLTDRYRDALDLYNAPDALRRVEWYNTGSETFMAGVPSRHMAEQWKQLRRRSAQTLSQKRKEASD